jgi:hypothetical protein
MVGAARLELTAPRSQSECATNCATPRIIDNLKEDKNQYIDFYDIFKELELKLKKGPAL